MIAIDGSENSLKAAEFALELAKSFGALLYAVTVTSVPESYNLKQVDVLKKASNFHDSIEDAQSWFEKFVHKAKENNVELIAELINSHRPVDYVLLEYAEEKNVELIVTWN